MGPRRAARQVAAKREQRVLLAEAWAATPTVIMQEPEEILLTALHDTNATLQAIKAELHVGIGESGFCWTSVYGSTGWAVSAKVVIDGELAEKLERRYRMGGCRPCGDDDGPVRSYVQALRGCLRLTGS